RGTVNPGTRAARCGYLALQYHETVLNLDTARVQPLAKDRVSLALEHALNCRSICAGAHEVGRTTLAEQQAQRFHDDGLARARLAGEHVEARCQRQGEGFDYR